MNDGSIESVHVLDMGGRGLCSRGGINVVKDHWRFAQTYSNRDDLGYMTLAVSKVSHCRGCGCKAWRQCLGPISTFERVTAIAVWWGGGFG